MKRSLVLVVDDDISVQSVMKMQIEEAGYQVAVANNGLKAQDVIREQQPQLVITDLRMPEMGGMELLNLVRNDHFDTTVIMITAFASVETAVEAMRAGAYDYVTKPINYEALVAVVHRAMERQNLLEEVRTLRSALDQRYGFESIIGHSRPLLRVLDMASRVAQHDSTVLIGGETGTGKELLARAIHHNSRRRNRPFVTINCGAIPKDLIESELFGHTRGAFTGAIAAKIGRIEMADGGTLFLDEIGELPLEMQVKLLRLLQQGEIEKVGQGSTTLVNVRVIAATHRNLQAMTEDGAFREDLYYRLAVVPLELPPLRERKEDIAELVTHLFRKLKERYNCPSMQMAASVKSLLSGYRWPGNIRELENAIERMLVLSSGNEITDADLPDEIRSAAPRRNTLLLELPEDGISLDGIERELIIKALDRFQGNQTHAARYLDVSRRTLIYRMEKHKLRSECA